MKNYYGKFVTKAQGSGTRGKFNCLFVVSLCVMIVVLTTCDNFMVKRILPTNGESGSAAKFVAVSDNGEYAYSYDGTRWEKGIMPSASRLITFGNGVFLGIVYFGWPYSFYSYYSNDGKTWKQGESILGVISCVNFGNGLFVGIDSNEEIKSFRSVDGINWTPGVTTFSKYISWCKPVFGKDKFVTVGYRHSSASTPSERAAYTTDGLNWTFVLMPGNTGYPGTQWRSIAYGNDIFVAIADEMAAYSSNGIAWTQFTLPINGLLTFGNDRFLIISANKAAYSFNGKDWTIVDIPNGIWRDITYGNGKFVVVGDLKGAYSTDGIDWIEITMPIPGKVWQGIAYGEK